MSLFEEIDTNSSSDSPVKKSSLSSLSELFDLSRCFFELLDAFLDCELEFVRDLSLFLLLFDRLVEVFDLLDFFDLFEFFDRDDFWLPLGDEGLRKFLLSSCILPRKLLGPMGICPIIPGTGPHPPIMGWKGA